MITDSQMHLWEADSPARPWPVTNGSAPPADSSFTAVDALAEMDIAGVDRAVIVPPIWAGDDQNNDVALAWAERHPGRFGVMGRFDMLRKDPAELADWRSRPGMLGVRQSYGPDFSWIDPEVRPAFWASAEDHGIPVMVLVMGPALDFVASVAERWPGVQIIVDHLGLTIGAPDPFSHFDRLLRLAPFANVSVKFSALPIFTTERFPFPGMRDNLRRAFEAFGADRCMWGSDVTLVRTLTPDVTYPESLGHVAETLDFLSPTDLEWVLGRSAARVLGWPE